MHLLVIEDDQRVSELLKRGLEENGYTVTVAFDGVTGKKLAISKGYDLIITNIVLPGINGLELIKEELVTQTHFTLTDLKRATIYS